MVELFQTNRAIALDEFNPEKPDIITLIGEAKHIDSLDDEAREEIKRHLLCYDFDEFLKKMDIKVFVIPDAGSGKLTCTLKRPESIPEHLYTEIPITEKNDVLKTMTTIIDAKRSGGTKNIDFGFETLLELIAPKKVLDDIRQMRKELQLNVDKYDSLPDGSPLKDDIGAKVNNLFAEARANYSNTMALLPLAIEDCEQRLFMGAGDDGPVAKRIAAGIAKFEEDGTLRIVEAPKVDENALALSEGGADSRLAALLEEDYAETSGEEEVSSYASALVVRTFSPLATKITTEVDLEKEVANHNNYLQLYTEFKAEFIRVIKPILERVLGVREFFMQYDVRSKAGMRPSLLIANATPEMLAKAPNLARLRVYLNTVNNKNEFDDAIWFAIFPNLIMNKSDDSKVQRKVFEVKEDHSRKDVNSMEVLTQLLGLMADYKVTTFFSFETSESTTFDAVAKNGITPFRDRCETLVNKNFSAYATPCFPNGTVIPKYRSGVVTGRLLETDGETVMKSDAEEDIMRFWIQGCYIPASYISAGAWAAFNCPEYLREKHRRNVAPGVPGVRYDPELGNNSLITTTKLAREIAGYTASTKEEINNQNFGFVLASENVKDKSGKAVSHITVYKARSLAMENQEFEPLYRTQVTTYFERVLRQATGDNKADNIKYFFSSNPESQMSKWGKLKESVNAIIQHGDTVEYEMETTGRNVDINFSFGGNTRNMQITLNRASAINE